MQEIERKFLVVNEEYKEQAISKNRIVQGYLNSHAERAVRIRIQEEKGFLTIKGRSNEAGTTRYEWEKEIRVTEAEQLLKLCEPGVIEKMRYEIKSGDHTFEVDAFLGDNEGLIVAEVELQSENEKFIIPAWLGKEVTGEVKYYNAQLSRNPFKTWHY